MPAKARVCCGDEMSNELVSWNISYWCCLCDMDRFPTEVRIDKSTPGYLPKCKKCNLLMNYFTTEPEDKLKFRSTRYIKPESKIKRFFKKAGKSIKNTFKRVKVKHYF